MSGRCPKGRYMIWLLAQQFRLDLQRGANLTEQSLLELDVESFSYNGLKSFVKKIEFVLNSIHQDHQPSERTKFTWFFGRVKRCKMIQRHIDKIKDSSPTLERSRQLFGNCEKIKTRSPLEMHFHLPNPRRKNQKAPMPPLLRRRRTQDRQRRCHRHKLSQRLSNPGKVMVKEKVKRRIQSPKGRLHRAKLNPLRKQKHRQKPKVSQLFHACFIQNVHTIVGQSVHVLMWAHQQQRRRPRRRPKLLQQQKSNRCHCTS